MRNLAQEHGNKITYSNTAFQDSPISAKDQHDVTVTSHQILSRYWLENGSLWRHCARESNAWCILLARLRHIWRDWWRVGRGRLRICHIPFLLFFQGLAWGEAVTTFQCFARLNTHHVRVSSIDVRKTKTEWINHVIAHFLSFWQLRHFPRSLWRHQTGINRRAVMTLVWCIIGYASLFFLTSHKSTLHMHHHFWTVSCRERHFRFWWSSAWLLPLQCRPQSSLELTIIVLRRTWRECEQNKK